MLGFAEKPNYEKFRLILKGLMVYEKQKSFEQYFGISSPFHKEVGILRESTAESSEPTGSSTTRNSPIKPLI